MAAHSPEWTQGYWRGFMTGANASYAEAATRFPEWTYDQLERYLNGSDDGIAEAKRSHRGYATPKSNSPT